MERYMFNHFKFAVWAIFLCPLGIHKDKNTDGTKSNFCGACLKQTNPNAFKTYTVKLKDGTEFYLQAVNEFHARNQIIYGGDNRICGKTGKPLGTIVVHPEHILSSEIKI
jgi:hypothetical protein